mgnify:CR=1 FL=1
MNKEPLVSIIMNCYNGAKYLQESLRSVINQTYQNWELIFWDNISSDDSKKIFSNFNENRFKYFLNDKHSILYHARNQAIKKANGDFIAFLDTDDVWLKDKLFKQIKLFSDEKIGLVYSNYWRYNKKSFFKKKRLVSLKQLPSGFITDNLLKEYNVGMLTVVLRKKFLIDKNQVFNTKFNMLSDMDFILKFSKKYKFNCIQEPLAIYRQHEDQLQNRNIEQQVEEMFQWYEETKDSKEFGSEEKLEILKEKYKFLEIVKFINKKFYMKSLKEIILYPNNLQKIKLFLILIFPKNFLNKFIGLR